MPRFVRRDFVTDYKQTILGSLRYLIIPLLMYVLGVGLANPGNLGYSFGFMILVEIIGTGIFNRVEATFMDTV